MKFFAILSLLFAHAVLMAYLVGPPSNNWGVFILTCIGWYLIGRHIDLFGSEQSAVKRTEREKNTDKNLEIK